MPHHRGGDGFRHHAAAATWGATPTDAAAAIAAFRADFVTAYFSVDVTTALVAAAMDLAERHGLRGYDAVQLAAALEVRDLCRPLGLPGPTFVAADAELNAALAEGLAVDDPNAHRPSLRPPLPLPRSLYLLLTTPRPIGYTPRYGCA